MPETHTNAGHHATLTPAQWAGLARLGDLGQRLGETVDSGPVGQILADGLNRLGPLTARGELTETLTALMEAVEALHRAGLLHWIRDNAEFVGNSLDTLAPLFEDVLARLGRMPLDALEQEASALIGQVRRLSRLADFIEQNLGGELAENAVRIAEFVRQEGTEDALRDLLLQLGRLHRSGLLTHVGDLAESAVTLTRDIDVEALAEALARSRPAAFAERVVDGLQALSSALAEAERDAEARAPNGGVGGLLKLLRDEEVQRSLHLLLRLPAHLENRGFDEAARSA